MIGLFSMITVEGEIEILNRRIGNLELVTGIRHTWTAATSAANRD
jgi:hypothetical protein